MGRVGFHRAGRGGRAPGGDAQVGGHPQDAQHVRRVRHEDGVGDALGPQDGGHRLERFEGRPAAILDQDPIGRDTPLEGVRPGRGGLRRPVAVGRLPPVTTRYP